MFGKHLGCCKCKSRDAETKTELVVDQLPRSHHILPDTRSPTFSIKLTKDYLKTITLQFWKQAHNGIQITAFANGNVDTSFPSVFRIEADLKCSVTRLSSAYNPPDLTVINFHFNDVSSIFEGPNLRTPSNSVEVPSMNKSEMDVSPNSKEAALLRSVQFVFQKPKGNIHSVCLISEDVGRRRDLFACLSVLRFVAKGRQPNICADIKEALPM